MISSTEILNKGALSHVTPSTWLNLQQCAWRVLMARHLKYKPLLPVHPNATLGEILHNVLEKITKRELRTREEFNQWWDEKVIKTEQDLIQKGWGQFVPLKENARHFGLKKVQARNRLFSFQGGQSHINGTFTVVAELEIVTADGLLAGRLDRIIWRDGQAEIRDYKTGVITTDTEGEETTPRVKEEYELQMKLYASLFHEKYGSYPVRLVLEDLNGVEYEVKFTPEECLLLLQCVKSLLSEINQKIAEKSEDLANIGQYCTFCNYRPACTKYLNLLKTDTGLPDKGWLDLSGELISIEENGTFGLGIYIFRNEELIKISGFDIKNKEKFTAFLNHQIAIFSVKLVSSQKFTSTKFSEIYAI